MEKQVRRSILKQRKKVQGLLSKPNLRQKGEDLEMLCRGTIKNMMCLRLKRRKPIMSRP